MSKWFIHGTKHHNDYQSQSLKHLCRVPQLEI